MTRPPWRARGGSCRQRLAGHGRHRAAAALPTSLLFTPGDVLRRHAQYNETSYNAFLLADAARRAPSAA